MGKQKTQGEKTAISKMTEKVRKTPYLSKLYADLGHDGRSKRVAGCAKTIVVDTCPEGHQHIASARLCRDRFCPVCAWRRTQMLYGQIIGVIHAAAETEKLKYIMLTLTIKNCPGESLPETSDKLLDAWKRMTDSRDKNKSCVMRGVRGWLRNLEVTRNKNDGSYHPHIHALLAVPRNYAFICQKTWISEWQKALGVDYAPSVRVSLVRSANGGDIEGAAAEVGKYAVKDTDYLSGQQKLDKNVLSVLLAGLTGRRLIAWGGLYRKIHRELDLIDTDRGNIDIDEHIATCATCGNGLLSELLTWDYNLSSYIPRGYIV